MAIVRFHILDNVRVGLCHVLQISGKHRDFPIKKMNLPSQAIVFVLASELFALKTLKNHLDGLHRLRQHGFTGNTGRYADKFRDFRY